MSQDWRDMEVMVRQTVKPDLLEKELGDQIVYSLIAENLRVCNSLIPTSLITYDLV